MTASKDHIGTRFYARQIDLCRDDNRGEFAGFGAGCTPVLIPAQPRRTLP